MRRLALPCAFPSLLVLAVACESMPPTDPGVEPAFAKPVAPPAGFVDFNDAIVAVGGAANTNIASNPSVVTFNTYRPGNTGSIFRTSIELNLDATKDQLFGPAGNSSNCVYEQKGTPDPVKQQNMRQLLEGALVRPAVLSHFVGTIHRSSLGVPSDSNYVTIAWVHDSQSELWLTLHGGSGFLSPPGVVPPVCNPTGNPDEWTCSGGAVRLLHRSGPQTANGSIACHAAPGDAWILRIQRNS